MNLAEFGSFLLGLAVAVAVGVLVEFLTGGTTKLLNRIRNRLSMRDAIYDQYDPQMDALTHLGSWTPQHRLKTNQLETRFIEANERPTQAFVDDRRLDEYVEECAKTATGDVAYLIDFAMNHQESRKTQTCYMTFAPSDYAEFRALPEIRKREPELLQMAQQSLATDASSYLKRAVPSVFAINLIPVSSDGYVLCAKRSPAAVDSGRGCWTVGVMETLKQPSANNPGLNEDLFGLAQRGLKEELGLEREEYREILVSWIGLYEPGLRGHAVAFMRVDLTRQEVLEHASASHSSYEHTRFKWLALNRQTVHSFLSSEKELNQQENINVIKYEEDPWLEFSRLAMVEAWKWRSKLKSSA
jgi:hypothetical protein